MKSRPNGIQIMFSDLTDGELQDELTRRNRSGLHLFDRGEGWLRERYEVDTRTFIYEPADDISDIWGDQ